MQYIYLNSAIIFILYMEAFIHIASADLWI